MVNTAQAKGEDREPLGLYVHVPFCATACDFCAFYQEAPRRDELERYLAAMEAELRQWPPDRPVTTVFWGGGTPGLLPARDLARLGEAMLAVCGGQPDEWTIEMAPSVIKADKIQVLRDLGVTRISMGVQSFEAQLLEALGRQHSPNVVHRAIETVHAAGFANLNLDLIFAVPGQTVEAWHADLDAALAVEPAHLSTYCLTFEEDTRLWVKLRQGAVTAHDETTEAAFYTTTWDRLAAAGFAQYEVSNYARPGRECIHNLNTWRMRAWRGYGPAAASQVGGRRFANVASLERWAAGVQEGIPAVEDEVMLTPALLWTDALIFGLRMNAGVDLGELRQRFGAGLEAVVAPVLAGWVEEGLLIREGDRVRVTRQGRLVADALGSAILEVVGDDALPVVQGAI